MTDPLLPALMIHRTSEFYPHLSGHNQSLQNLSPVCQEIRTDPRTDPFFARRTGMDLRDERPKCACPGKLAMSSRDASISYTFKIRLVQIRSSSSR